MALISKEMGNFDRPHLLKILSLDLEPNNIALSKATKWIAKIFDIHEEEVEGSLVVSEEIGEAVQYLDMSAKSKMEFSLMGITSLLQLNCSKIDSEEFRLIEHAIDNMSAIERKWFCRYWLRLPRNGMSKGNTIKLMAKYYKKKQATVKKHTNFNTIYSTALYYDAGNEPTTNLAHGKFVAPMLAKEMDMKDWPKEYIVDYKYDGNRYQIHKNGKDIIVFNRKGKDVTEKFPDVCAWVSTYSVNSAIFDGEIYPIDESGGPKAHKFMGTRVHSKDVMEAMDKAPVAWVIFDCLKWEDETIMDLPYSQRLEYFKHNPHQAHRIYGGDILNFYDEAIRKGFEGIIIKDSSIPYEPGKRSKGWVKYKPPMIELDVVILSASYGEGKRAGVFGTFEIGVKSDNGYISVGQVGNGLKEYEFAILTNQLRKLVESHKDGKYHFLPRIVLEVLADLISQDAKGNIGLRFPRVSRIRNDKYVEDINTIEDVRRKMK